MVVYCANYPFPVGVKVIDFEGVVRVDSDEIIRRSFLGDDQENSFGTAVAFYSNITEMKKEALSLYKAQVAFEDSVQSLIESPSGSLAVSPEISDETKRVFTHLSMKKATVTRFEFRSDAKLICSLLNANERFLQHMVSEGLIHDLDEIITTIPSESSLEIGFMRYRDGIITYTETQVEPQPQKTDNQNGQPESVDRTAESEPDATEAEGKATEPKAEEVI